MKNFKLLRPINLATLRIGTKLHYFNDVNHTRTVIAPPNKDNQFVIECDDTSTYICVKEDNYLLAPLCWVEDKPVYKGDVLYSTLSSIKGEKHTIIGINKRNILHTEEGGENICAPQNLTWQAPKVKKHGWMNCYPNLIDNVLHKTKEHADMEAMNHRITCVYIEWEE